MWLLKTPQQCFPYKGGAGFLAFNNLKWYWPSKRKLVSFPTWLVNWGLTAGIDPNWKPYYTGWWQGCTLALLLCRSIALNSPTFPLPQNTAAIYSPNSVIIVILFTAFSENLALEQLVHTAPWNISTDDHTRSSQEIARLLLCVAVSYVSLTTQSAACWCKALRKRIVPVAGEELGKTISKPKDTHIQSTVIIQNGETEQACVSRCSATWSPTAKPNPDCTNTKDTWFALSLPVWSSAHRLRLVQAHNERP